VGTRVLVPHAAVPRNSFSTDGKEYCEQQILN
jgi:hypothetical protein